ncbi:MAG: LXG domain-containing protein [Coriobacteriia bacterium]|nr:LXG domain-containing protein [Coriobacteriia bacterium]
MANKRIDKREVRNEIDANNRLIAQRITDVNAIVKAINAYINDTTLKGKAYSSSKKYMKTYFLPLCKGIVAANNELKSANGRLRNNLNVIKGDRIDVSQMLQAQTRAKNGASTLQSRINTLRIKAQNSTDPIDSFSISQQIRQLQTMLDNSNGDAAQYGKVLDSINAFEAASNPVYNTAKQMFAQLVKAEAQINTIRYSASTGCYTLPAKLPPWIAKLKTLEKQAAVEAALVQLRSDTGAYNWGTVKAWLNKDPKDITPVQYEALIRLIQGMTYVDAKGVVQVDTKALSHLIECGYALEPGYGTTNNPSVASALAGTMGYAYKVTPAFQTLAALYVQTVKTELSKYGPAYFKADVGDPLVGYIKQEVFKASLLSNMAFTTTQIVVTSEGLTSHNLTINISPHLDTNGKIYSYTVSSNGQMLTGNLVPGKSTPESGNLTIYTFSQSSEKQFIDYAKSWASSGLQKPGQILADDIGSEIAGKIIGAVISLPESIPGINLALSAGKEAGKILDITASNQEIKSFKDELSLAPYFTAVHASVSFTTYANGKKMKVNLVSIDENKLRLDIEAYNADPSNKTKLTLSQVEKEFSTLLATGKAGKEIRSYCDWYASKP